MPRPTHSVAYRARRKRQLTRRNDLRWVDYHVRIGNFGAPNILLEKHMTPEQIAAVLSELRGEREKQDVRDGRLGLER